MKIRKPIILRKSRVTSTIFLCLEGIYNSKVGIEIFFSGVPDLESLLDNAYPICYLGALSKREEVLLSAKI